MRKDIADMPLFQRFRHKPPIDTIGIEEIRERVRRMRDQIDQRDVALTDLFELIGEDERSAQRTMARAPVTAEAVRVWPHEIPPESATTTDRAIEPRVTYGDWELMRPPAKFTV